MTVCAHCQRQQRGSSSCYVEGRLVHLCHTDVGMDCYKLVTQRGHQPFDCPCKHGLQYLSPKMLAVIADYDTVQVDLIAGLISHQRALRAAEAVVHTLAKRSTESG